MLSIEEGMEKGCQQAACVTSNPAEDGSMAEEYEDCIHTSQVIGKYGELRKIDSVKGGKEVLREREYDLGECDSQGHMPARGLGWKSVAMLQIGDVVGVGVLTMGSAFLQLGFVLCIILLVLFLALNVYVGILLSRSYALIPAGASYGEMSRLTVRSKAFHWLVAIVFYVYVTSALGGYVLAAGQTLGELFFHWETCQPIQSLAAAAILLLPLQLRSFTAAKPLLWLNTFCLMLAIFLCLGFMLANMSAHHAEMALKGWNISTYAFPQEMTWLTLFNGIGKLCFAYLGQYLYLEIQTEMKKPGDFPKAFSISGPFQLIMYAFVGIVSFSYDGQFTKDSIIKQLTPLQSPELLIAASAALFFHLCISFLIKGKVLCRALHNKVHHRTVNDPSWRGMLVWFFCTLALVFTTYLIANAIPIFGVLTSLLGGFAGPFLGFICPVVFFLGAHKVTETPIRTWERYLLYGIIVFAVLLLGMCTSANIVTLINALQKGSQESPFSCDAQSYYNQDHSFT